MNATAVAFSEQSLDRAAHLRTAEKVEELAAQPEARVLPLWRGKPLVAHTETASLGWLPMDAEVLADAVEPPLFLGLIDGEPRFAADVSKWSDPNADKDALRAFVDRTENHHPSLPETHRFRALRMLLTELPDTDTGDVATARSLLEWHRTHRFCSRCGAPSHPDQGGWRRVCDSCGAQHFPRTDPVVIMLVTSGDDVLLGRSPGWPDGMYSLLAGFVEPGETIEAAVRREVIEESAVEVGDVKILATQPWPFPSSLMIGCVGEALTRDITIDPVELEDAIWVSRERCALALAGHVPDLMPARKGAIARSLLEAWVRDTV
ncbi:MAG: NAD(+) diphosphatase [Pseudomonadota bacterium]